MDKLAFIVFRVGDSVRIYNNGRIPYASRFLIGAIGYVTKIDAFGDCDIHFCDPDVRQRHVGKVSSTCLEIYLFQDAI